MDAHSRSEAKLQARVRQQEVVAALGQQALEADDHDGTGIGLALVERVVERHGGDVRVESDRCEGTAVSFTLAAVEDGDDGE
jgi:signal transduction histidine kinase